MTGNEVGLNEERVNALELEDRKRRLKRAQHRLAMGPGLIMLSMAYGRYLPS